MLPRTAELLAPLKWTGHQRDAHLRQILAAQGRTGVGTRARASPATARALPDSLHRPVEGLRTGLAALSVAGATVAAAPLALAAVRVVAHAALLLLLRRRRRNAA